MVVVDVLVLSLLLFDFGQNVQGDRGHEISPGRKLLFAYSWLFRTLERDEWAKMTDFWCFLELPTGTKGAERDEPVAYAFSVSWASTNFHFGLAAKADFTTSSFSFSQIEQVEYTTRCIQGRPS